MISKSQKIRRLFELGRDRIDLPYFSGFPENACEGASLFLGATLKEIFPESHIDYLKGYDKNGAIHFWLEVDAKIFDITADQFSEIREPIFGADYQPLAKIYCDIEKKEITDALNESDVTTKTYKHSLMMDIRYYLKNNI